MIFALSNKGLGTLRGKQWQGILAARNGLSAMGAVRKRFAGNRMQLRCHARNSAYVMNFLRPSSTARVWLKR